MKTSKLLIVTMIAAFLCGCSNTADILEETSSEAKKNMSATETVSENETETLSAVEQEFERAKENNRFPDFELSYEMDADDSIIFRFYNAERELEVLTDNRSYATINCNDKTLTINEGFTFFGGTGDYTGMGFEDCTGDGKEELVICITYGGTNNDPSKYRIVEPETMTLYNLSEDIETADIWDRIDNAINYEAVSVITLDKFQYVVGKFVQEDGTVHYTRDNKDSCELPDVLTEIEAMCAKTVRVGTYNGKLAAKFTVYVTGKNSEISAMNFGSADIWVDITYNSNEKKFEYGDILKTEYRKEIPEENWYVSGNWQQEYDIAVIADDRDVEHLSYKGDWCMHAVDNNSGVEMYKFLNSENRYEFIYGDKVVETVRDLGYCGWTFADLTGDGIPELIYNDGLYEVGCKVWDLFDTDKTYEVKDIRKNHIDRLKLENITIDGENIIYDIDTEDWQTNSFTGKINNTDLTDTDSYSIRPDNIVSEFKIFYDTSNKKVAMKFDIDITNVTATEKVMTCTVFLEYDKENDTVMTQEQQIYSIESSGWSYN